MENPKSTSARECRLTYNSSSPPSTLAVVTRLGSVMPVFAAHRVHMIYLKLVLVLVYAFGRSDLEDQAVMFWGVLTAWSVWSCTHPPYRCRSSNR